MSVLDEKNWARRRSVARCATASFRTVAAIVVSGMPLIAPAAELTVDTVVLRPLVEADAPARQIGVLSTFEVTEGDVFKKDELLASLDDRAARLAVQQAELERDQTAARAENRLSIEYADKALEVARAELRRSQESIAQFPKSVSQSQIDVERLTVEKLELERRQAERELELLRYELRVKENAVEAAQLQLELHGIRAPFDGVVVLVRGRLGEWVEPGALVMRLIAVDRLRAEGYAPAAEMRPGHVGRRVRFVVAHSDGTTYSAEGILRFVSPEMDPVTKQVRIWAEIDNAARHVRPGAQGRLTILASEARALHQSADAR